MTKKTIIAVIGKPRNTSPHVGKEIPRKGMNFDINVTTIKSARNSIKYLTYFCLTSRSYYFVIDIRMVDCLI